MDAAAETRPAVAGTGTAQGCMQTLTEAGDRSEVSVTGTGIAENCIADAAGNGAGPTEMTSESTCGMAGTEVLF